MYVLNLHFDPVLEKTDDVERLIDALKFVYPTITWASGHELDSSKGLVDFRYSRSVLVSKPNQDDVDLLRSRTRYIELGELGASKPIEGWSWVDEVLARKRNEEGGFEETSGLFNSLNESENKYTNDDLEFFYKNKIPFYEIRPSTGVPFEADEFHHDEGIPYDEIGLHLWVGKTKDYYDICWDSNRRFKGYNCMENGPDELIHNLNSGRLIPVDVYRNKYSGDDLFNQLNESEMEERFKSHPLLFSGVVIQPSDGIEGIRTALKLLDKVGVPTREGAKWDQADIEFVYEDYLLKNEPVFIGVDYSNRTQGEGLYLAWGSPNFFKKKYSESGLKYKIYTLPEFVSMLEGVDFGYSNFFGDLNESNGEHLDPNWFSSDFKIGDIVSLNHDSEFLNDGTPYNPNSMDIQGVIEDIVDDEPLPYFVKWKDGSRTYVNTYSDYDLDLVLRPDYDQTIDLFSSLNESKYQPKLNLRFDNPIMYNYELNKVLRVLSDRYPGLQWAGGSPVLEWNPMDDDNELDFTYEPIYYLTIGFFNHKPDKLTYTSGYIDDESYADDEHHMYTWVDGWQWVKDNQIDYDETTNLFNQLNESEDDLDWARQVVNDVVLGKEGINVGDVFYIVDGGPGAHNVHPDDYTPRNVRYVITITNITEEPFEGEDIKVEYEDCDPQNVTYNPKDYSIEKPRCYDYDGGEDGELASGLAWALDLVKKKYWRPMGSSL